MAYTSDNDKLFFSKLDDGIYLSEKRQRAYFFPFFTEREQALAERYLVSVGFHRFAFFGGYEGAERKMLGLFFYEEEEFPLCAVRFSFRKSDKLSHRDFLGAIMSLGVERETVGDILVEDGSCVVFVRSEIRDYIVSEFGYDLTRTLDEIRPTYHHVEDCMRTMPEAFECFLEAELVEGVGLDGYLPTSLLGLRLSLKACT